MFNTAYQLVAQRLGGAAFASACSDFSFRAFMDGPLARVRRKPARARCAPLRHAACARHACSAALEPEPAGLRACSAAGPPVMPAPLSSPPNPCSRSVIVRTLDVGVNADAVVNMLHDYTAVRRGLGLGGVEGGGMRGERGNRPPRPLPSHQRPAVPAHVVDPPPSLRTPSRHPSHHPPCMTRAQRTLEELFIRGPVANPRDNPEYAQVRATVYCKAQAAHRAWSVVRRLAQAASSGAGVQ